jgi:hypothetical protein
MSSFAFLWPAAACAIAGAALYVTRGALDQVSVGGTIVRIALLPPWEALAGFVSLAALVLLGIDRFTVRRQRRRGDVVLPALALAVLLVPFLPVLPDQLPVLQVLAGPLRGIVWLVVTALLVWTLLQAHGFATGVGGPTTKLTIAIGVATAIVAGAAASGLTGTVLFPSGDEPHYLVIAQSLWRDRDLKIENNHERGDYQEYFHSTLDPDYLTRGADAEIYPIHPVGLPLMMAPVYAAGGYRAVVMVLVAIAATAAALAWRWIALTLGARSPATFAWAAVALTAPFLFNAFTVYPEIPSSLVVIVALSLAQGAAGAATASTRWLAIGLACGALPWLSTKYAPMSAAVMGVAWFRLSGSPLASGSDPFSVFRKGSDPGIRHRMAWLVTPYVLSLITWSAFFYVIWGSPSPTAPYGSMTQTSPINLPLGLPGLLFDQEYGLLAYAPIYVLAATGVFAMWKAGGEVRRRAIETGLVFGALILTVASHRLWWGGTAAPGRPLAAGLLLLALPVAAAFQAAPAGSARRAGQHVLLWVSVGIAITLCVAQRGFLMSNGRDGTSTLIEWWLPQWEMWTLVPSFIQHAPPTAVLHAGVWVAIAAVAARVLARWKIAQPGAAALAALGTFAVALLTAAIVMPWLPANPPAPRVNALARSRLTALEAFDARALPAALVFDPFRKVASTEILPLLTLGVTPGARAEPQPLRVLHNGRFSLPAGTFDVGVTFGPEAPERRLPLSLQVGRIGPPLDTFDVAVRPGGHWRTSITLPVDAGFFALRGSVEIERAIQSVAITPTHIVDAGSRRHVPEVLAAVRSGPAILILHDEQMYQQPGGFWTQGERRTEVTVTGARDRTSPVVLRVHSGGQANSATFRARGWEQRVTLAPGVSQEITLPQTPDHIVALNIETASGFLPWKVDPASRDRRFLGIWIEALQP